MMKGLFGTNNASHRIAKPEKSSLAEETTESIKIVENRMIVNVQ